MAYGTIARCKTDWLVLADSVADTQLTGLLETVNRKIDNVLNPYVTVPLTGSDITDFVKRISEQWTAALYIMATSKGEDEFVKGKDLEDRAMKDLDGYAETISQVGLVTTTSEYMTSPIADS